MMDIGDKRNGGAVMVDRSPLKLAIVLDLVSTEDTGQDFVESKVARFRMRLEICFNNNEQRTHTLMNETKPACGAILMQSTLRLGFCSKVCLRGNHISDPRKCVQSCNYVYCAY